jgi:cell division protein FtsN
MAARRGKSQARRSGAGKRSGIVWLAVGLAIGGLAFGYLHFKDQLPATSLGGLLPKPDPNATAKPASSDDAVAEVPEKPRTKYDFYKLLPEKEVVIPDAELAEQARAEAAQAKALEAERAARAAAAADAGTGPADDSLSLDGDGPSSTAAAPAANTASAPDGATAAAAPTAPTAAPASSEGPHYVIQAGAFLGNSEAEALKAKIALTGEVARVEVAQINGNTVHRVRMGPYPNAASLAAAKSALAAHGIDAQAIRVK